MTKQKQIHTTYSNITTINPVSTTPAAARRISNWTEYSRSLVNRGNCTVLLNKAVLGGTPEQTGKAGHPIEHANAIILFLAQLRELMRLPLRQTIGLARFIFAQAGITLTLPSYATLSRRLAKLGVPTNLNTLIMSQPIILLPDSTGLKVSGEGEWKVKKHGKDKRRQWVKVHLGVDYASRNIVAVHTTDQYAHDGPELPALLDQVPVELVVKEVIADGAYGGKLLYDEARKRDITLIVPPPKNAIWRGDIKNGQLVDTPGWEARNSYVRSCMRLGRDGWKHHVGYHKRSLAETSMYRLKNTFGGSLKSRTKANQVAEVKIRVSLLNLFTTYGLPQYVAT
jgi:hypothetical protein